MNLLDLPLLGRKFNWFHLNSGSVSRLDNILVSNGWWDRRGIDAQWALPRDVYDHCPIFLK